MCGPSAPPPHSPPINFNSPLQLGITSPLSQSHRPLAVLTVPLTCGLISPLHSLLTSGQQPLLLCASSSCLNGAKKISFLPNNWCCRLSAKTSHSSHLFYTMPSTKQFWKGISQRFSNLWLLQESRCPAHECSTGPTSGLIFQNYYSRLSSGAGIKLPTYNYLFSASRDGVRWKLPFILPPY